MVSGMMPKSNQKLWWTFLVFFGRCSNFEPCVAFVYVYQHRIFHLFYSICVSDFDWTEVKKFWDEPIRFKLIIHRIGVSFPLQQSFHCLFVVPKSMINRSIIYDLLWFVSTTKTNPSPFPPATNGKIWINYQKVIPNRLNFQSEKKWIENICKCAFCGKKKRIET